MLTAFDTLLQTVVTANSAAINGDNEAFRYECLCCGEEVFLAAQDSNYMATHFRHRSGNNDKDCELYLGQYGVIQDSKNRRNKQERIEFYYNNSTKCFYVSLNFSAEEIHEYEQVGAMLEIRESRNAKPFFNTSIDHSTFSDGVPERFVLDKNATPYFVSNTLNNKKREYYVFNYDSPSFFKILSNDPDDEGFIAKLIRSKSIHTGVRYFIAWPGRNTAQIKLKSIPDVFVENETQFITLGRTTVWGMVVSFKNKNPLLDSILNDWGYNLDVSESVSLLWPPAYEKGEKLVVSSSQLYLRSSFRFQEFGNINITEKCITEITNSITKISLHEPIHILKKNAELEIYKEFLSTPTQTIEVKEGQATCFCVPQDNSFFLFSDFGVEKLSEGQKVYLTQNSYIAEYVDNLLVRTISFLEPSIPDIEAIFYEIISCYWITKNYQDIFAESLPQSIKEYLETCKDTMRINQAVERLIKDEAK